MSETLVGMVVVQLCTIQIMVEPGKVLLKDGLTIIHHGATKEVVVGEVYNGLVSYKKSHILNIYYCLLSMYVIAYNLDPNQSYDPMKACYNSQYSAWCNQIDGGAGGPHQPCKLFKENSYS